MRYAQASPTTPAAPADTDAELVRRAGAVNDGHDGAANAGSTLDAGTSDTGTPNESGR